MQIDIQWMKTWFDKFNHDYFRGGLPLPRFGLSKSRTRLGSMGCKRRIRMGKSEFYDYSIHLSNYYDQTERQYQNVMLHEMIHFSIAYTGQKDTSPHGVVFRGMMDSLNRKYGWEISVMTSTRNVNVSEEMKSKRIRERLILVIKMKGGKRFVSVVNPRYARTLNSQLRRVAQVESFDWYTSVDAYFSDFTVVRSLRGRSISEETFNGLMPKLKKIIF